MAESGAPPPLGKTASMPASTMLLNLDVCPVPPFPVRAHSTVHSSRLNSSSSNPAEKEVREVTPITSKAHFGRKLQVVVLLDQKVAKHQKVRELAWVELLKIADCLNIKINRIEFDRLDFGETSALDAFYNADIALVDISIRQQCPSLCYHIGVRESMGQAYNM
uniref:MAP3K deoxyribohydrolase domain-containing protein n=1 Tax=Plectus sambesii TaxID=2011161 RepID=A0A914VCP2_9BILA